MQSGGVIQEGVNNIGNGGGFKEEGIKNIGNVVQNIVPLKTLLCHHQCPAFRGISFRDGTGFKSNPGIPGFFGTGLA